MPDTVTTLTPPAAANDTAGIILQSNGAVRYTLDGSNPTASRGFRITSTDGENRIDIPGGGVVKVINEVAGTLLDYQFIGNYS